MSNRELTFADLTSAAARRDPQFAELVVRYVEQPDPPENAPEEPTADTPPPLPADAYTLAKLRAAVTHGLYGKNDGEKHAARREAWASLMAAEHPPPRLQLGDLLIELYDQDDEWSRASLVEIVRRARVGWGLWRGLKAIYKRAEARHDAEMFGVLAWRFDAMDDTLRTQNEVGRGTFIYMKRRPWRYLRQLGRALPELYPQFAVQVLRHYSASFGFHRSWVANQIWAHEDLIGATSAWMQGPPAKLDRRAYHDAWKLSPDPLLRLLEDAGHDAVCAFAIRGLEEDFPEALRAVRPAWLARIGGKRLRSVDEFVVKQLEANPELHQSKLAGLGLQDMVVGMLRSDSDRAVEYAIAYCNAHVPSIPVDDLIDIAEAQRRQSAIQAFVLARLEGYGPRDIGLAVLVRMLRVSTLSKLAVTRLREGFTPDDLDADTYVRLAMGDQAQQKFVNEFFAAAKREVPAAFLRAHAEHPKLAYYQRSRVLNELAKRPARDIGIQWIQDAVFDNRFASAVSSWLTRGKLKGSDLDVDWVKSLAMRPAKRSLGLSLLTNTELVTPHRVGLDWLLRTAQHANEQLSKFAHDYLLQHFAPDDFALAVDSAELEDGIDHIWSLLDPARPMPVRKFAGTYLKVHHPELSATTEEARALGIQPRLPRESYTVDRVRPYLFDARADIRQFAAAVGRYELTRWGDVGLVYELAASQHREARALGAEALLRIGEPDADPRVVPDASWLRADRVFGMAESPVKATREIALTLIRRHYRALGGAPKLAWLMDSPDREVRLFAVRLLWDQHRPLAPARRAAGGDGDGAQRFDSTEALQQFMRGVLFGLPPGRMERRDAGTERAERALPASVAKRRLIEVVRDMGIVDGEFAAMISPVLEEFLRSEAKGEWHGCVAALARMRAAHPSLSTSLPAGATPVTATASS